MPRTGRVIQTVHNPATLDPPPTVPAGGVVGVSATGEELGVYDADGHLIARYRLDEAGSTFVLVPGTVSGSSTEGVP